MDPSMTVPKPQVPALLRSCRMLLYDTKYDRAPKSAPFHRGRVNGMTASVREPSDEEREENPRETRRRNKCQ